MPNSETAAKAKYNKKTYDDVCIRVGKGGNAYIKDLARRDGKSKAEYIRSLIIADALKKGDKTAASKIGGGGALTFKNGVILTSDLKLKTIPTPPPILRLKDNIKEQADKQKAIENFLTFLKNKHKVSPVHVRARLEQLFTTFGINVGEGVPSPSRGES